MSLQPGLYCLWLTQIWSVKIDTFSVIPTEYHHRQYYLGVGCWGSGVHGEGGIPYTPTLKVFIEVFSSLLLGTYKEP